jgi:hypothetical protein
MILQACSTLLLILLSRELLGLFLNIQRCKSIGLPYYVFPMGDSVATFLMNNSPLRSWIKLVPLQLRPYAYMTFTTYRWQGKAKLYDELGPVILQATPRMIVAHVADAKAVLEITHRRADFPKPTHDYGGLAEVDC